MRTVKLALASATALAFTSIGVIADGMPAKGAAPVAAAPSFSWSGSYIGANIGAAWLDHDRSAWTPANAATTVNFAGCIGNGSCPTGLTPDTRTGVIGGIQVGYNWQMSNIVLGIETDFQGSTANGSTTASLPFGGGFPNIENTTYNVNLEWFGTVRARLGMLISPTMMAYVTGGFAYGEVARSWGFNQTNVPGAPTAITFGRDSSISTGWTVGGGLEALIAGNVTIGAEYLYLNLGGDNFATTNFAAGCAAANCSFNIRGGDLDAHIARLKVNFKL